MSVVLVALCADSVLGDMQVSSSADRSGPGHGAEASAGREGHADQAGTSRRVDGVRIISFSGYEWAVKSSTAPVGPGPNFFSDSFDSVWVDGQGRLHLRIAYRSGRWWAAEVILQDSLGYGTYRFFVDGRIDGLDPNVVLGLFTWSDDPAFYHREIDIEISRWGQEENDNAQCVVQPYHRPGNSVRFSIPSGLLGSIHSFTWTPANIVCRSVGVKTSGRSGDIIHEHAFDEAVPPADNESARINLWLIGGSPPTDGRDVEVVIGRFEFEPLESTLVTD